MRAYQVSAVARTVHRWWVEQRLYYPPVSIPLSAGAVALDWTLAQAVIAMAVSGFVAVESLEAAVAAVVERSGKVIHMASTGSVEAEHIPEEEEEEEDSRGGIPSIPDCLPWRQWNLEVFRAAERLATLIYVEIEGISLTSIMESSKLDE